MSLGIGGGITGSVILIGIVAGLVWYKMGKR